MSRCGFNGGRRYQGGFVWLAPLVTLVGTAITAKAGKTQAKTQAHIAELQLQTEQKSIDAQIAASTLERDARVAEQVTAQKAIESKSAVTATTVEKALTYVPYFIGAFVLILLAPLLMRKRK